MIYLDANIIIRLVEGDAATRAPIELRLAASWGVPFSMTTSRLTRLECRVKPLRNADTRLLQQFEVFLTGLDVRMIDVSSAVIERATDLRAHYNFKAPDAIHLATAIQSNCPVFLTGDKALARCAEIPVEVL